MNVLVVVLILVIGLVLFVPPRWLLVGFVLSVVLALLIRFHAQILPALKATWTRVRDLVRGHRNPNP